MARAPIFMVMREGHLVFEGAQAELEASQDPYISKFVKHTNRTDDAYPHKK